MNRADKIFFRSVAATLGLCGVGLLMIISEIWGFHVSDDVWTGMYCALALGLAGMIVGVVLLLNFNKDNQ
jgi:hypothetical protein